MVLTYCAKGAARAPDKCGNVVGEAGEGTLGTWGWRIEAVAGAAEEENNQGGADHDDT